MAKYIERIEACGIHGRLDIVLDLHPGLNIVYGPNGCGKTTLLHIITNLVRGELDRFRYLAFDNITLHVHGEQPVTIAGDGEGKRPSTVPYSRPVGREAVMARAADCREDDAAWGEDDSAMPGLSVEYVPAFRMVFETVEQAIRYMEEDDDGFSTHAMRSSFGPFTPEVTFPSLDTIGRVVSMRARHADFGAERSRRLIMDDAFARVFELDISDGVQPSADMPDRLNRLLKQATAAPPHRPILSESSGYGRILAAISRPGVNPRLLALYLDTLSRQLAAREEAWAEVDRYFLAVNSFLEGKQLRFGSPDGRRRPSVYVEFDDGARASFRCLSSGERQVAGLLFMASPLGKEPGNDQVVRSDDRVVLIDEPELSLHVDWQRMLMSKMAEQLGQCQVIACTHSPQIGVDWQDNYFVLDPPPRGRHG